MVGLIEFGQIEKVGAGEGGEIGIEGEYGICGYEEGGAVGLFIQGFYCVFYGEACFADSSEAVDYGGLGNGGGLGGGELVC